MIISENIKIYPLETHCTTIFVYIQEMLFVYLQIQMKFGMCGKAVNTDRST